jgi:uncharacterized protein YlzI (FlbEa/FlbD family)
MQHMIILTTLAGKDLFVNPRRIYAVQDKSSHSVVFAGNESFVVAETPSMIFDLYDGIS